MLVWVFALLENDAAIDDRHQHIHVTDAFDRNLENIAIQNNEVCGLADFNRPAQVTVAPYDRAISGDNPQRFRQ